MTPWLLLLLFIVSLLCFVMVAIGIPSLARFSRSRLENLGEAAGNVTRIGQILLRHEVVHDRLEVVSLLAFPVTWVLFVTTLHSWSSDGSSINFLRGVDSVDGGLLELLSLFAMYVVLRGVSIAAPESLLLHLWPLLEITSNIARPMMPIISAFTMLTRQVFGIVIETQSDAESLTEEIRSVAEEGHREGVIEEDARTMIHRVIDFGEVDVADVMTPRTEMICIPVTASILDARQVLLKEGHSRIPVIGETTDEVLGILHARDLLRYLDGSTGQAVKLTDIAREPFYIPKTMAVPKLLATFRHQRTHLAIVLDEYGGVAGLVTMEDILEELVGEIGDEFDPAGGSELFRNVGPGVTDVSAKAHLDDVTEKLGIEFPTDGQVDTLGGFVFSYLGRIPVNGEQFRIGNVQFTVLEALKRRIVRLRLTIESDVEEKIEN